MKLNYKIDYNHTLKEYLTKVDDTKLKYAKILLIEAQEFDKKFHSYSYDETNKKFIYQYRILNNKCWWFIDNAFYEVPPKFISNK